MKYINILVLIFALFATQLQAGLVEVTESSFENSVIQSKKPVVVVVSATWCKPCQQLKPILNDLSNTLSSTHQFAKVDFEKNRSIANKYSVTGLPTLLFFQDGELKSTNTGVMSKQQLEAKMQSVFN